MVDEKKGFTLSGKLLSASIQTTTVYMTISHNLIKFSNTITE